MPSLIATDGVTKTYGKRTVVSGVSVYVKTGTIVGLLGPNGAGKTTTFYMIVGLVRPDTGRVLMDGAEVTRLPIHKRARMGVGYLAQEASIFRRMTVEENLLSILEFTEPDRRKRKPRAHELMEEFSVTHVAKSQGYALSGGERRRVEIARALCNSPDFLLLDEPFAGVDPIAVQEIQRIVSYLKNTKGLGILITDHNVRETLKITERTYVIHQGKVLVEGGVEEITQNEHARKIYLGDSFQMDEAIGSTPANGSSSIINFGRVTRARVISRRRRSPPESWKALLFRRCLMLNSSNSSSSRASRSSRVRSSVSRIARMLSSTDSFRKIEGSCERYPMPRRARRNIGIEVMSSPSSTIRPLLGAMRPTIM